MYVRGIILVLLAAAFTVLPTPAPAQTTYDRPRSRRAVHRDDLGCQDPHGRMSSQ